MNNQTAALLASHPRAALLTAIGTDAAAAGYRTAVVGGFVRDLLLGILSQDIDIVVAGDAIACAQLLAGRLDGEVAKTSRFGTAVLTVAGERIDLAMARKERYPRPGALPEVSPGTLEEDLLRRDFTVNAMAIDISPASFGLLLDRLGGQRDLEGRIIRILHRDSFRDDPTRLLRAVRLAHRLKFAFDPLTARCFREAVGERCWLSAGRHRIARELALLFHEDGLPGLLQALDLHGLFRPLFGTDLTAEKMARLGRLPDAVARFARWGAAVDRAALAAAILGGQDGYWTGEAAASRHWQAELPPSGNLLSNPGAGDAQLTAALSGIPAPALAYLWIICQNEKEQARLETFLANALRCRRSPAKPEESGTMPGA